MTRSKNFLTEEQRSFSKAKAIKDALTEDLQRFLLEDMARFCEQCFRRGFYQGYFEALRDGPSLKEKEEIFYEKLTPWRFSDEYDQALTPPCHPRRWNHSSVDRLILEIKPYNYVAQVLSYLNSSRVSKENKTDS